MSQPIPPRTFGPAAWVKLLVSAAILWQFYAILTTTTAASSPRFPPPRVASWAYQNTTKWYLEPLFMTNPYRFYAPDPGPTHLLWYRVEYANGGVRWIDFADRQSFPCRIPYQRHMCLNMMGVSFHLSDNPDPRRASYSVLLPKGRVGVESYARHAAAAVPAVTTDGKPNPVRRIDICFLEHWIAEPTHLRMGWTVHDLRLHPNVAFLGTYGPDGQRINLDKDDRPYELERWQMSQLAGWIVDDLVASQSFKGLEGSALEARMTELQVPVAIRTLLLQFPELLQPARADEMTAVRIRRLVESRDLEEMKRLATPGMHYPVDW